MNANSLPPIVMRRLPRTDVASIILNASIVASNGNAGTTVYNAIKAAVRSFARTWAGELRGRHIRVNAVSPGYIATPGLQSLSEQLTGPGSWEQFDASVSNAVPFGRLGTVEDVADAVLFLGFGNRGYITGAELLVDGGFSSV